MICCLDFRGEMPDKHGSTPYIRTGGRHVSFEGRIAWTFPALVSRCCLGAKTPPCARSTINPSWHPPRKISHLTMATNDHAQHVLTPHHSSPPPLRQRNPQRPLHPLRRLPPPRRQQRPPARLPPANLPQHTSALLRCPWRPT